MDVKLSCRQCGTYWLSAGYEGSSTRWQSPSTSCLHFEIKDRICSWHFVAKSYGNFADTGTTPILRHCGDTRLPWKNATCCLKWTWNGPAKKKAVDMTVFGYCLSCSAQTEHCANFHLTSWRQHSCLMKRELVHFFTPRDRPGIFSVIIYKDATLQNISRRLLEITTSEKKPLGCLQIR